MQEPIEPGRTQTLLKTLQNLLTKQIRLVRQGDITGVDILSRQTSEFVKELAGSGVLEQEQFRDRRVELEKLYQELCLALAAQRADVCAKLKQVSSGRKTVRTYRNNV